MCWEGMNRIAYCTRCVVPFHSFIHSFISFFLLLLNFCLFPSSLCEESRREMVVTIITIIRPPLRRRRRPHPSPSSKGPTFPSIYYTHTYCGITVKKYSVARHSTQSAPSSSSWVLAVVNERVRPKRLPPQPSHSLSHSLRSKQGPTTSSVKIIEQIEMERERDSNTKNRTE